MSVMPIMPLSAPTPVNIQSPNLGNTLYQAALINQQNQQTQQQQYALGAQKAVAAEIAQYGIPQDPASTQAAIQRVAAQGYDPNLVMQIGKEMIGQQQQQLALKLGQQRYDLMQPVPTGEQPQAPGAGVPAAPPQGAQTPAAQTNPSGAPAAAPIWLRQNNPGNLRTSDGTGFQTFPDMNSGLAAMSNQLATYGSKYGINTVAGVVSRYAPPSDKNNTPAYIQQVAQSMGVDPNAPIDLSDPQVRSKMMQAMIPIETGSKNFTPAMINAAVMPPAQGVQVAQGGNIASDMPSPGASPTPGSTPDQSAGKPWYLQPPGQPTGQPAAPQAGGQTPWYAQPPGGPAVPQGQGPGANPLAWQNAPPGISHFMNPNGMLARVMAQPQLAMYPDVAEAANTELKMIQAAHPEIAAQAAAYQTALTEAAKVQAQEQGAGPIAQATSQGTEQGKIQAQKDAGTFQTPQDIQQAKIQEAQALGEQKQKQDELAAAPAAVQALAERQLRLGQILQKADAGGMTGGAKQILGQVVSAYGDMLPLDPATKQRIIDGGANATDLSKLTSQEVLGSMHQMAGGQRISEALMSLVGKANAGASMDGAEIRSVLGPVMDSNSRAFDAAAIPLNTYTSNDPELTQKNKAVLKMWSDVRDQGNQMRQAVNNSPPGTPTGRRVQLSPDGQSFMEVP